LDPANQSSAYPNRRRNASFFDKQEGDVFVHSEKLAQFMERQQHAHGMNTQKVADFRPENAQPDHAMSGPVRAATTGCNIWTYSLSKLHLGQRCRNSPRPWAQRKIAALLGLTTRLY
jgi:hypothetical protein